eukprot:scpid72297/ scgid24503/ 
MLLLSAAIVVALVAVPSVSATAADCTFTLGAKKYDLSPLKAANGSYVVSQSIDDSQGGYLYFNNEEGVTSKYTFQLQICGNVEQPVSKACKTPAPVYMISEDGQTCMALGNIEAAAFNENPYKDGINLRMYNGDAVSHIQDYAATIYFVCNPKLKMQAPAFEHMTNFYAAHFKVFTSLVC